MYVIIFVLKSFSFQLILRFVRSDFRLYFVSVLLNISVSLFVSVNEIISISVSVSISVSEYITAEIVVIIDISAAFCPLSCFHVRIFCYTLQSSTLK